MGKGMGVTAWGGAKIPGGSGEGLGEGVAGVGRWLKEEDAVPISSRFKAVGFAGTDAIEGPALGGRGMLGVKGAWGGVSETGAGDGTDTGGATRGGSAFGTLGFGAPAKRPKGSSSRPLPLKLRGEAPAVKLPAAFKASAAAALAFISLQFVQMGWPSKTPRQLAQ